MPLLFFDFLYPGVPAGRLMLFVAASITARFTRETRPTVCEPIRGHGVVAVIVMGGHVAIPAENRWGHSSHNE